MKDNKTTEIAREFAKLGAGKGGHARANVLTADERTEIARNAVRARWAKAGKLKQALPSDSTQPVVANNVDQKHEDAQPYSMFRGTLKIGTLELECHVLNDFRRVLTQREVVRVLSGGRESGNLVAYLQTNPLIDVEQTVGATFPFKIPGLPTLANGYEATVLIDICDKYLEAWDRGLIQRASQKKLVAQASIVIRASAKVGIIALIDEATGYQEHRAKNALQLKLQAFIADEMQDWARMFPDEFWYELARLEGIRYSPRARPLRWGKYIMMFVYDAIDKDVGKYLRETNPNPHFKQNHHQWLKQFGRDKVNNQIQRVITVMKLCNGMDDFKRKFAKVFQRSGYQFDIFKEIT